MTHYSQYITWVQELNVNNEKHADLHASWLGILRDDNIGTGRARIIINRIDRLSRNKIRIHVLTSKNALNSIIDSFVPGTRFKLNGQMTTTNTYTKLL